jgi:hypothetical protein
MGTPNPNASTAGATTGGAMATSTGTTAPPPQPLVQTSSPGMTQPLSANKPGANAVLGQGSVQGATNQAQALTQAVGQVSPSYAKANPNNMLGPGTGGGSY